MKKGVRDMQFRLGELFCGPGGIAWGATHADIGNPEFSIVHQWANDYDASTCETYRHNICPDAPQTVYHEDIRKFDMTKLAPIDALAFGFPCNDYSVVGEPKGMDGVYGPLYSYGVKALKLFKPQSVKIYAREGLVICGLGWILVSLFGSLPFIISGAIPNFVNAFLKPHQVLPPQVQLY